MRKKNLLIKISIAGLGCAVTLLPSAEAQTVLSGDHVVEGDLEVGSAIQKGGVVIKGETGNTANQGIRLTGDGGVIFEGASGVGSMPQVTVGKPTLMWYPKKAALRVGLDSIGWWDDQYIGFNSVAFGTAIASGENSAAMSSGGALGDDSTAFSYGEAYGAYSTAMSTGIALGRGSTAMSGGYTDGIMSTVLAGGDAGGIGAVAMSGGMAYAYLTTAISLGRAIGDYSIAGGVEAEAIAYRSVAFGSHTNIDWNESPDKWVETDSIFVIGNGTGVASDPPERMRSNALVVLKNGNVLIPKRQGDILMGEFGNPEP